MITLDLSLYTNHKGAGFWKLNTLLLTESNQVILTQSNLIKSVINDTQKQYEADDVVSGCTAMEYD